MKQYKTCRDCGVAKPIEKFRRTAGGYRTECRDCELETRAEYRERQKYKPINNLLNRWER